LPHLSPASCGRSRLGSSYAGGAARRRCTWNTAEAGSLASARDASRILRRRTQPAVQQHLAPADPGGRVEGDPRFLARLAARSAAPPLLGPGFLSLGQAVDMIRKSEPLGALFLVIHDLSPPAVPAREIAPRPFRHCGPLPRAQHIGKRAARALTWINRPGRHQAPAPPFRERHAVRLVQSIVLVVGRSLLACLTFAGVLWWLMG